MTKNPVALRTALNELYFTRVLKQDFSQLASLHTQVKSVYTVELVYVEDETCNELLIGAWVEADITGEITYTNYKGPKLTPTHLYITSQWLRNYRYFKYANN